MTGWSFLHDEGGGDARDESFKANSDDPQHRQRNEGWGKSRGEVGDRKARDTDRDEAAATEVVRQSCERKRAERPKRKDRAEVRQSRDVGVEFGRDCRKRQDQDRAAEREQHDGETRPCQGSSLLKVQFDHDL